MAFKMAKENEPAQVEGSLQINGLSPLARAVTLTGDFSHK